MLLPTCQKLQWVHLPEVLREVLQEVPQGVHQEALRHRVPRLQQLYFRQIIPNPQVVQRMDERERHQAEEVAKETTPHKSLVDGRIVPGEGPKDAITPLVEEDTVGREDGATVMNNFGNHLK